MSEEETDRSESGSEESEPDRSVEPPTYDILVEGGYGGRFEITRKDDKSDREEE
jgi:hypothetical protein